MLCKCRGRIGQGLSMNTLIIAAVGLIVLIIIIGVSVSKFRSFSEGTGEIQDSMKGKCATPGTSRQCYNQGGSEQEKQANCIEDGGVVIPGGPWAECNTNDICCSI